MTIHQILRKYSDIETDLLLSHVLGKPKEFLYIYSKMELSSRQYRRLLKMIKRRQDGEPIAYILGYKYFYSLKFKVNKHVLIPRPETEWLVDHVINCYVKMTAVNKTKQINILDIGTGSGCIAISVASVIATRGILVVHKDSPCSIIASDISDKALIVAKQNAKIHKANVNFIKSDLLKNVPGKFNIIIANLPYVPHGMYELLYHNLKYEPKISITDGGEVWELYESFFKELPRHLKPGGTALLEIDDGAKSAMQKMIKKLLPTWKTKFSKDLGGLWRYMELRPH